MSKKLEKKINIKGSIEIKTGLHIGGTNTAMNIGGIDKSVIRNPLNNQPIIPGSSLKGKLRSLFQVSIGKYDEKPNGKVIYVSTDNEADAHLFGNATGNEKQKPSRLIVRDCTLENADDVLKKTEIPYTEGKTEVVIDRITSAASPRQIERVPAGAKFSLNLVLNIWTGENETELMTNLFASLKLLTDDYLGGSGSRGYGQVAIAIQSVKERSADYYLGTVAEKDITEHYLADIKKLKA